MGRGAGNLNTELITDYLNKNYKSSGNINKTSEVIDGKKNFVLLE